MKSPVAIFTGGGRRLGRQIALSLGRHGYDVVINYHKSKKGAEQLARVIRKYGQEAISISADVSKRREVNRMVERTVGRFGRIDLLVNSSGIFLPSPLKNTTESIWDRTMEVNLKGPFLSSQAVGLFMLTQKFGKIINIASIGGIQAWAQHLPYSVSKA